MFTWEYDWPMMVIGLILVILLILAILLLVDMVWKGESTEFIAEIVDGEYKESTLRTHVQPIVANNGTVGLLVMSSGESEHITMVIRDLRDNEIFSIKSNDLNLLYDLGIGDQVVVSERFGKIFGTVSYTIIRKYE